MMNLVVNMAALKAVPKAASPVVNLAKAKKPKGARSLAKAALVRAGAAAIPAAVTAPRLERAARAKAVVNYPARAVRNPVATIVTEPRNPVRARVVKEKLESQERAGKARVNQVAVAPRQERVARAMILVLALALGQSQVRRAALPKGIHPRIQRKTAVLVAARRVLRS